jgi:uncharacterized membrane protein
MENVVNQTSISDISLRLSDNGGYIVNYTEKIKSINPQMNSDYNYKSEVFESGEKALKRLAELSGINMEEDKE